MSIVLVVFGIALLYFGGELLVEHAIRMARIFGVSTMVIGLTVVAFATSAPELAAALAATLGGSPDIAVGNAVGSNIANVCLILGITGLIYPLTTNRRFLRRELAFMLVATIVIYPLMRVGLEIGRLEGAFLLLMLFVFLRNLIKNPDDQPIPGLESDEPAVPLWRSGTGVGIGVVLLVGGAQALVMGASDIARDMGVPERVIGLSLVALGTSLPELAASLAAGRKGQGDLVLGNIVGSNIFNLLCILGLTAVVHPIAVAPAAISLDYWVMFGSSFLLLLFLAIGHAMNRVESMALLAAYSFYMVYLYLPTDS